MALLDLDPDLLPEVAYYYPERLWTPDLSGWVKSLLLFFDGVALLAGPTGRRNALKSDPELVGPLLDSRLLHLLEPSEVITADAVAVMAESVRQFIDRAPHLDTDSRPFRTLGSPTLGMEADAEIAAALIAQLSTRGLIQEWENKRYQVHPLIHGLILCIWAQTLRAPGRALGLELLPTTDNTRVVDGLMSYLRIATPTHYKPALLELDLQVVLPSLESVPLDEVLDFRKQHGAEYRAYQRSLNQAVVQLTAADPRERKQLIVDRQRALLDTRNHLRKEATLAFKLKTGAAPFLLGIVGGTVGGASSDVGGALAGAGGGLLAGVGTLLNSRAGSTEFSYLFQVQRMWAGRS